MINLRAIFAKHGGLILTAVELGSIGYAIYRAYKDGPKFKAKYDELKEKEAKPLEYFKELAPIAAPTLMAATVAGSTSIAKQHYYNNKIQTLKADLGSLGSAYVVSNDIHRRIEEKAKEEIGEEKFEKLKKEVMEERKKEKERDNFLRREEIERTKYGRDLFIEDISGHKFENDINHIKSVINELNYQMLHGEMKIPVAELYSGWGLNTRLDTECEKLYFDVDQGLIDVSFIPSKDDYDRVLTIIHFNNDPIECRGY